MIDLARPDLERVTVTLSRTSAGVGFTSVKRLFSLGRAGRILAIKVREDATNDTATSATLFVADAALTATPDDLAVFYQSSSMALTGHGTEASYADALPVPASYVVSAAGDLRIAAEITAIGSGSDIDLHVLVIAEVWR